VKECKYLGFFISSNGNNMVNIKSMEKKSFEVIRTIMNKLESLKLKQYYFECAIIFMNVILRPSILYGGECYYNLTESQLRSIERIEVSTIFGIIFLLSFFSFRATYFSPRRGFPRVMKFCMEF
jgi:hypothetical protein